MKIALIQFNAIDHKGDNIGRAISFIQEASSKEASWILFPEVFSFRGNLLNQEILSSIPETIPGETTQIFQELAKQYQTHILLGSILEKTENQKPSNTSVAINKDGEIAAKYQKINLFDAKVDGKIICESDFFSGGDKEAMVAVEEFKVGLSICYDVRFPGLYQEYARLGAHVLTVPSCFTRITGQAHWETLLKARAIENLCFVLAPNQVGRDARGIQSHGHSMVISPWGEILAQGSSDKEEIVYADLSMDQIIEARGKLPGIIK